MKYLTKKQLDFLKKHNSVERVTSKQVIFSFDFKLRVVKEYLKGISPHEVFSKEGLNFIPSKKITNSALRWREKYNLEGENGLVEKKKGRKVLTEVDNSELSHDELLAKVAYLEQENDFLKKLKALRNK